MTVTLHYYAQMNDNRDISRNINIILEENQTLNAELTDYKRKNRQLKEEIQRLKRFKEDNDALKLELAKSKRKVKSLQKKCFSLKNELDSSRPDKVNNMPEGFGFMFDMGCNNVDKKPKVC